MASDLISRAEAIQSISDWIKDCDNESMNDAVTVIKTLIKLLHAVDAEPVVHARWIASDKYKGYLVCSNCADAYVAPAWLDEGKWRFCPACGARMDGGDT